MKKVRFRPRAWQDIQESAEYLADEASAEVAERFLNAIDELTHKLAGLPQIGVACHFCNPRLRGVRRFPVAGFEKWLVFYQASDAGIEIVRVLHGARDIASILDPGAPRL
jgi:toxin ParE1/3/4